MRRRRKRRKSVNIIWFVQKQLCFPAPRDESCCFVAVQEQRKCYMMNFLLCLCQINLITLWICVCLWVLCFFFLMKAERVSISLLSPLCPFIMFTVPVPRSFSKAQTSGPACTVRCRRLVTLSSDSSTSTSSSCHASAYVKEEVEAVTSCRCSPGIYPPWTAAGPGGRSAAGRCARCRTGWCRWSSWSCRAGRPLGCTPRRPADTRRVKRSGCTSGEANPRFANFIWWLDTPENSTFSLLFTAQCKILVR